MTFWSFKKKNQQEILNVSHPFVLVFFKDFWNLLKKEKAEILDVDRNNYRNPMYWEDTQQRKKECKLQIFTRYKVFLINKTPQLPKTQEWDWAGTSVPAISLLPEKAEFPPLVVEKLCIVGYCKKIPDVWEDQML